MRVFTRCWYVADGHGGRKPGPGRKSYSGHPSGLTEEEAVRYCREWNASHAPGMYSRKAEFEA